MTAGVLSYTDDHLLEDVSRLKAAVSAMARVQRAVFHRDFEVVKSLLSNAKTDSDSEVRFTNFKMLIDDFGSSAETADAAQHLLTDSSPKLRLLAAATIGDPCHAKVKSEFESLRAMDFVTKNGAGESALMNYGKWLVLALRRVDFPGREEALRDVLGLAIEMHSRYINSDTGYVLAQAGRETACGAMDALGEVGTAASVETLLQFSSGFLTEAGFKKAANGAIASIQSRVQGADAGQLMLSGADLTDAGQLALSSNDGELALTPEAPLVESD